MNAWRLVVVLGLCAGGGAIVALQQKQQAQLEQMSAQVDGLREALARERALAAAAAPGRALLERALASPVVTPVVVEPSGPAPQAPQPQAPPPLSPQERAAQVELGFQRQREDPAWSGKARQQVAQALAARLPTQASVRGLDCRATLCRLELLYADEEAHQEFVQRALLAGGDPLWRGGVFLPTPEPQPDGKRLAVLYLGRDDQPLLPPDAL